MYFKFIFVSLLIFMGSALSGQNDCKVLLEDLVGKYTGKCKKGLAHGKGLATGKDQYKGKFKSGLPNGYGAYTYANGDKYIGKWKQGRRNGKGTYYFVLSGENIVRKGYWEDDVYVGPKKISPYKVNSKRNIDRYNVNRIGDGNDIIITISQNGINNSQIEDLILHGDSGTQMPVSSYTGFENIDFPFRGVIRYKSFNKMRTVKIDVLFDFEIIKEGSWKINLHN